MGKVFFSVTLSLDGLIAPQSMAEGGSDDLWIRNAAHANAMARRLAESVRDIPGVRLSRAPEVNSVFVTLPAESIAPLQARSFFWPWDESIHEVRWMTSFDTTAADIDAFASLLRDQLG